MKAISTQPKRSQFANINLTDEQIQIIEADIQHTVITAVAGSGKTTTLAYRIKHLLRQGLAARRILILMFNRSAKEDFARKLAEISGLGTELPEVRTFHSMGYRLYARFIKEGALPTFNKEILSEFEVQHQLWRLIRLHAPSELQEDIKRNKKEHVEIAQQFLASVKATIVGMEAVFEEHQYETKFDYLKQVFYGFEEWRKQQARISYDDMLYDPVIAMLKHPELTKLVANKMDVILVDEYQDTNEIQHHLLKTIAGERAKVTVVGDPDQTIYEFRGARPEYMINEFAAEFSGANEQTLSHSFRYGHGVSLLANHLITKNKGRKDILCKSHHSNPNTQIQLQRYQNQAPEICQWLSRLQQHELSQTAILLRTWSQSVPIELQCLLEGIPYNITDRKGVFHTTEVRAMMALLEISAGLIGSLSAERKRVVFEQIFRFPHIGLPEQELKNLAASLAGVNQNFGEHLVGHIPQDLKKFQISKLERLGLALSSLEHSKSTALVTIQHYADEVNLYDGLRSLSLTSDLAEERVATVKGFLLFLKQIDDFPALALKRLTELRASEKRHSPQGLHISTIHRAKGLEWPIVMVPTLEEQKFPYTVRTKTISSEVIESERRLLYVAMTRSKQQLVLWAPSPLDNPERASEFIQELSFEVCSSLKTALEQGKPACSIPNSSRSNMIVPRYLAAIQAKVELSYEQQEHNQDEIITVETDWSNKGMRHSIFGVGKVIEDQGKSFTVQFKDDSKKKFNKDNAHLYFALD